MNHLSIAPILIPSISAILMLLPPLAERIALQRWLAWISLTLLLGASALLLIQVDQQTQIYLLGGWQPPFGIMLLADRLAVMLVTLTAFLALCACLYGATQEESSGRFFYPLFMFQIMGINGAFLTGDIFNLFVFFEVLLIASYALLIHGGGKEKTKASFHYIFD